MWQILFPKKIVTVQTPSKMFSWEIFENFQGKYSLEPPLEGRFCKALNTLVAKLK